ncbi:MAG TPA: UDP-N-acetylmuramate dehydrogenase [Blastocatellia bacterium]|nr:UDP-N-acetylmuramate dehydrogenase [Blastocatellia bacterium]
MLSVIRENVRLAPYTTLRIGGVARYFADIDHEDQLCAALQFAEEKKLPTFVLGGGSNVLIADAGFPGVVLHIVNNGITFHKAKKDAALVTAAAGEEWDTVVQQCVARDLAGVECLSGIPGYVGGTPIQNVGAYGQEVSETIVSVRAFDRHTKQIVVMTRQDCLFSYRASIFNTTARDRYIVLEVTYKLKPHGAPTLHYADLQRHFARHKKPPTLQEVREAVLAIRASKGMVIVPSDPDCQSAGSFFKNPMVTREQFAHIEAAAAEPVPHFPAPNEQVKIPAAWLIEKAGFTKGYERGRVGISSKHTLAIINRSNATARELLAFVAQIQNQVQERFGLVLVPEPVWIGLENQPPIPLAPVLPKVESPPRQTEPSAVPTFPLQPSRKFRKPEHNPLKTTRKKWFE